MTVKARNQALHDFEQDENVLILLMSNVGAVGLNITRASVVIFVVSKLSSHLQFTANYSQDQPWSFSELMQVIGRIWRKNQESPVHVVRLILKGTADETMSGYANCKSLMQDHLTKEENLLDDIHGQDEGSCVEEDDEEVVTQSSKRGRKPSAVKPRPRKSKPNKKDLVASNDEGTLGSPAQLASSVAPLPSLPLQKGQAKTKGPATFLDTSNVDSSGQLPLPVVAPLSRPPAQADEAKDVDIALLGDAIAANPPLKPALPAAAAPPGLPVPPIENAMHQTEHIVSDKAPSAATAEQSSRTRDAKGMGKATQGGVVRSAAVQSPPQPWQQPLALLPGQQALLSVSGDSSRVALADSPAAASSLQELRGDD
jgi:superfamily II DNA/RNA helicase